MDFDPVLLARLQFAFTIIFHIIFPSFTIGLSAYIATLGASGCARGNERYHQLMRFWTQDFRRLLRDGRGVGHCAVIPVRHQLEPLLGDGRQCGRPADRLRSVSAHFFSRQPSSAFCCSASIACRHGSMCCRRAIVAIGTAIVGVLDFVGQQLDADADRPRASRTASPTRPIGSRSFSIRASPIASPTCSMRLT